MFGFIGIILGVFVLFSYTACAELDFNSCSTCIKEGWGAEDIKSGRESFTENNLQAILFLNFKKHEDLALARKISKFHRHLDTNFIIYLDVPLAQLDEFIRQQFLKWPKLMEYRIDINKTEALQYDAKNTPCLLIGDQKYETEDSIIDKLHSLIKQ